MYLEDLKGSLGRDTDRARSLLAKLIGRVTLRRKGQGLVVELQGNLLGLLELDNQPLHKGGSGGWVYSRTNIGDVAGIGPVFAELAR